MSVSTGLIRTPNSLLPLTSKPQDFPYRNLRKADVLYHAGDIAGTVYRIEEGLLKLSMDLLTGKERIISIVGPEDFIGALTPAHQHFQETAEVLSPEVRVQVIPSTELAEELSQEVFAAAGKHIIRLQEALEDSELPVNVRLARAFVQLGQRFGTLSEDHTVSLMLPLTHDNLAAMVGAARETTTALLGEMRAAGLLSGTRGRYRFNLHDLNNFAATTAP